MHTTLLTLVGFTFTTICASICPMNMGGMDSMMSMHHGDVQMMEHAMDMGEDQKEMPCKRCEQDEDEVAALSAPTSIFQIVSHVPFVAFSSLSTYTDVIHAQQIRSILANAPPIPTETLVGTVILRT